MAIKDLSRRSRALTAVGAGCVAAGVLAASAASLGTLTVSTLGTTANVVAACQTDDALALTSWGSTYSGASTATASTGSSFNVNSVVLTGVAAGCQGKSFKFVLATSTGASLTETSGTVTTGSYQTITIAGTVDSKVVDQATLTIYQ